MYKTSIDEKIKSLKEEYGDNKVHFEIFAKPPGGTDPLLEDPGTGVAYLFVHLCK